MSQLIYCATPSRIAHNRQQIMDFVTQQGYAPLHPFQAFPYERFEGDPVIGRQRSMEWCLRLVDISDQLWVFGISRGTLQELTHALTIGKPFRSFFREFDPTFSEHVEQFRAIYRGALEQLQI